jgi:protein lysine acetyltransferase
VTEAEQQVVLARDDLTVLVRAIRPEDKELLRAGFDRLSPESRYRRFFAPLDHLSDQDLRYLTEVDHSDHEALVAIDPKSGDAIGVARYVRSDDPAEAEVAVVVADPWQHHGLGTTLLEHLVERAREEGIDHFVALVLSDNDPALEMFRSLAPGGSQTRRSASGHIEMLIELPEPGELPGSRLGRLLGATAREAYRINPWQIFRQAIGRRPTEETQLPED